MEIQTEAATKVEPPTPVVSEHHVGDSTGGVGGSLVADRLDWLREELSAIRRELRAADERAGARERVIDRLHDENERLRAGERHLLLRPIQTDLQRLRNDLLRQASGRPHDYDGPKAAALLTSFASSVELTLERCGIRVVRPDVGSVFDSSQHRAAETVPADTAKFDLTIAEVVSDGYFDTVAERVVVPAAVLVRHWQPTDVPKPRPLDVPSVRSPSH